MAKTKQLVKMDHEYVWHPFTQMKEWKKDPMVIVDRAKKSYLIDTDGNKYLDGVSSLWCNVHGHCVPEIDKAVKSQLARVAHSTFLGLSNVSAIKLSKELIGIAPKGLRKVFYSDSGSEAVEIALKMAFQYWQLKGKKKKQGFLRLKNAYHGDTVGSVSVGGIQIFHDIFKPLLFDTYSVEAPHQYRDSFKGTEAQYAAHCAKRVESVLKKHHHRISAMIMEPLVQGAAGIITHPKGFLKHVRRLTKKYNVLLILDEVATGFGRSGKMFACEKESVSPDILCVAKGLTGGYLPLSATLTTNQIYNVFLGDYKEFKTFFHGHTYTANPLACAAALENIRYFKKNKVMGRVSKMINELKKGLEAVSELKHVGEIRRCGLMTGIELVKDRKSKKPFPLEDKMGARVAMEARKNGVIIRPLGNVVVIMPPFSFTNSEIKKLCVATLKAIRKITEKK